MTKQIKNIVAETPIQCAGSNIKAYIYMQDTYHILKIHYPKCGRSHFYSMVNYIDQLFDEQYPEWSQIMHNEIRTK